MVRGYRRVCRVSTSLNHASESFAALECFVLCSLEFSIGPIVLNVVFWVVHLATVACWYRRKLDGSAKQSSYIREVIFVRDVHSTDDLF